MSASAVGVIAFAIIVGSVSVVATLGLCVQFIAKFVGYIFTDNRDEKEKDKDANAAIQPQQNQELADKSSGEKQVAITAHVRDSTGSLGDLYRKVEYWSKMSAAVLSVCFAVIAWFVTLGVEQKNDVVPRYIFFLIVCEVLIFLLILAGMRAQERDDRETGIVCTVCRTVLQFYVGISVAGLALEIYAETDAQKGVRDGMRFFSGAVWGLPPTYMFFAVCGAVIEPESEFAVHSYKRAADKAMASAQTGIKHSVLLLGPCLILGLYSGLVIRQPSTDVFKQVGLGGENQDGTRSSDAGWLAFQILWIIAKCVSVAFSIAKPTINVVYRRKVILLFTTLEDLRVVHIDRLKVLLLMLILREFRNGEIQVEENFMQLVSQALEEVNADLERKETELRAKLLETAEYVY